MAVMEQYVPSKAFSLPERKHNFALASYVDDDGNVVPWQLEDLQYLMELPYSANWSEMGCYKTTSVEWLIEAKRRLDDALVKERGKEFKVLIVTTKSGKGTYFQTVPDVLRGWTTYNVATDKVALILGDVELKMPKLPLDATKPTIVVTHYNVFSNRTRKKALEPGEMPKVTMCDELLFHDWDMVILDEAHRIKNRDAQWTIQLKKLNARYKHIMTGTGFINNPAEMWSLLHFLHKERWPSYWQFFENYVDYYIDGRGQRVVTGLNKRNAPAFRAMRKRLGPRRMKMEVFKDMKEPIFTRVDVELSRVQRRMYNEIKQNLRALDEMGEPIDSPNVLSMLNRLRQISVATPVKVGEHYDAKLDRVIQEIKLTEPSSKLDAVMELLENLEWSEEGKEQVVIFSNFRDPIELLKVRLNRAHISYIHMQQKDNDRTRYEKWAIEFPKKEHQVFLSTLQLGSESINLTPAQTCIFLDRSWSPKDNEQGVARVWRPGQTGTAHIIHIEATRTTDQRIEKKTHEKLGWFKEIFGADADNDD